MRKLSMSLGKTEDAEKKEWGYDQQGPPPLRLWTLPAGVEAEPIKTTALSRPCGCCAFATRGACSYLCRVNERWRSSCSWPNV